MSWIKQHLVISNTVVLHIRLGCPCAINSTSLLLNDYHCTVPQTSHYVELIILKKLIDKDAWKCSCRCGLIKKSALKLYIHLQLF